MKELLKLNPQAFLVVTTTLGFFTLVLLMFFRIRELPDGIKDILQILLGVIAGQYNTIVQYFFGSSSGSSKKTDLMNTLSGNGDGTTTTRSTVKTETEIKSETPPKETP